jgi:hypothetical protein
MNFHSSSHVFTDSDSAKAAESAANALRAAFGAHPLRTVIVYATVNHDEAALLRTLKGALGPDVLILGCSVQGIASNGTVRERGFLLGVMGLGGEALEIAATLERDFQTDTRAKGKSLGARLKSKLGKEPQIAIVLYDPLSGADVESMLAGFTEEIVSPVIGGGASAPFGRLVRTFQYWGDEALSNSVIALGLAGPFSVEIGVCHGTSPTGVTMTLTRTEANKLLEIDGRRALDIWREVIGCTEEEINFQDNVSNWAIGIERRFLRPNGEQGSMYFIRASFGFDVAAGTVVVQASIPEGSKIMFHHRTVAAVTEGTARMGRELAARLNGRRPWAVLGFECGARTSPFLGDAGTLEENVALQQAVSPETPWLGMMAWGEIAPVGGTPAFHNYTYPLVVLAS